MHDRTTLLILRGTTIAVVVLGVLLIVYNGIVHSAWLRGHTWIVVSIFIYLLIAERTFRNKHREVVNWMLIAFYMVLAFFTLLTWGLNAPVGILTISFAIILPSILIGSRSIFIVTVLSIFILIIVQILNGTRIVPPNLQHLSLESTFWDVATYSTILAIFALVSWIAVNQKEKSLKRALLAESALKSQKENLVIELEKESTALRLAQLNEVRHLHKFALLGQSTAATLHELSNHLSVLNLDIDDLHQQHNNSKAIQDAKESISHINKMVSQARRQLSSYDETESFNAVSVVRQSVKDASEKYKQHKVKLHLIHPSNNKRHFIIQGSPFALMQIIAILLNNALDATMEAKGGTVSVELKTTSTKLYISVTDNGPGINPIVAKSLFHPSTSTKKSGLGVGLYIARHLAHDQFKGDIKLATTNQGASFLVTLPSGRLT